MIVDTGAKRKCILLRVSLDNIVSIAGLIGHNVFWGLFDYIVQTYTVHVTDLGYKIMYNVESRTRGMSIVGAV